MSTPVPTAQLLDVESVGEGQFLLSKPDVRSGQVLAAQSEFETRDGFVTGRVGDIAVTGYGKERWPIKREIFLGSYKVLGHVGDYVVAQRLIHVRHAWRVESAGATFDYGDGRGRVDASSGGWLYQSADDDFGYLHPSVAEEGHQFVGSQADIKSTSWAKRVAWAQGVLVLLPPVMAALALLALLANLLCWNLPVGHLFSYVELALLVGGAILVWRMHVEKWIQRSLVESGQAICLRFQCALSLLNEPTSQLFPAMTLWSAYQKFKIPGAAPRTLGSQIPINFDHVKQVRTQIGEVLGEIAGAEISAHRVERAILWATFFAFVGVVSINIALVSGLNSITAEAAVIWLPYLLATTHAFALRRKLADRQSDDLSLAKVLSFVNLHLLRIESAKAVDDQLDENIRLLCGVIANHGQKQLEYASADRPQLPV